VHQIFTKIQDCANLGVAVEEKALLWGRWFW